MLASGFETQADLAQQIAYNEGITKPPRDLVSKVFREQAVSPHNLARIAKALQVPTYTIYLSKDDNRFSEVLSGQSDEPETLQANVMYSQSGPFAASRVIPKIGFAMLALVILMGSLIWWQQSSADHASSHPASTRLTSPLGKVLIVVQAPANLHELAELIASQLSEQNAIRAIVLSRPEAYLLPANEVMTTWQAHGVLHLTQHEERYYDAISATMISNQHSLIIHQSLFHHAAFAAQTAAIGNSIVLQSQRFIAGEPLAPILSNSGVALNYFLQGKNQLFISNSANSFLLAESHLLQALEQDTSFAAAHAELCRLYVRSSWIQEETASLEKAATYCQLAAEQRPDLLEVITAQAELLARSGRTEQALVLLNEHASLTSTDADALAVKASVYQARFGEDDTVPPGELAIAYAKQAVDLVPGHWYANNILGSLYFMQGNAQQAIAQFAKASMQHEIILANLGTLQLCYGELEQAEETYWAVINNFDNDRLGHENLGTIYQMQGKYELAIKHKQLAINEQPEVAIHQVWSNLGELYFLLGQPESAKHYYNHALTLIERDELLGNLSRSDLLHKVYYQTKLQKLTTEMALPDSLPQQVAVFFDVKDELDLHAKSHLAWLLGIVNLPEEKQQIRQELAAACPVYELLPELSLKDQS
ncbi:tetratricopeptide repeat protein [Alkalimonas sp. NCh-2]|uniref:tetratricopeptide repeat protein n=1 Tax=Alkalimonas sp. NCh-2 TaxID=3144846 RepID=UPI0031F6B656